MHLKTIRNFEWYNEPELALDSDCMTITVAPNTDFQRDRERGINKDNGHFFFSRPKGNFNLRVNWQFCSNLPQGAQYGLMARIDSNNWAKIGVITNADGTFSIMTSTTNLGVSDIAVYPLSNAATDIFFRLEKIDQDLCFSFSSDNENFVRIRWFQMIADCNELKVGAYACNPQKADFCAVLSDMEFY